ncbi:MAG: SUMF1/EgtB/PvdO family nonheme iron enzyme [Bacteroidota bacterium]|nr:SUMF1/EgtB/PvdO family nonheme iron enzyme [Bacteroidota bacterium]
MKMRQLLSPAVVALAVIFFSSCGGGDRGIGLGNVSHTTGWAYNSSENGGFEVAPYNEQRTGPGLILIEGGAFQMGRTEQDLMYSWNNQPRRVTLASFYMDQTEVRNVDYREYVHWVRKVFSDMKQVYLDVLPDTLVWRRPLAFNEPYVEYYFRHPSYHNYPVVGVDWNQANDYCLWRTDRVNEQILIDEGILEHNPADQLGEKNFNTEAYFAGMYEGQVRQNLPTLDGSGSRPVKVEDGILLPKYRLPTEAEWEYAALALKGNSETSPERIWSHKLYPWNGHYLRNDSKRDLGKFRANFKRGRGDLMGVAGALNDKAAITAPVDSYWPNDFGLYCMAGNVNEWVQDVYRPLSSQDVNDFRPVRGNVFTVLETDNDGNFLNPDSLGRMKRRRMTDEENEKRHNYHSSYNINYKDGDVKFSVVDDWSADPVENSKDMYVQGDDKGKGIRSLITDHARVYKGGGWNDRAYWLVPGARRFLDENQAKDDLGFRCAMIRVGSTSGN